MTRKQGIPHIHLLQDSLSSHEAQIVQLAANSLSIQMFTHWPYSHYVIPQQCILFLNLKQLKKQPKIILIVMKRSYWHVIAGLLR